MMDFKIDNFSASKFQDAFRAKLDDATKDKVREIHARLTDKHHEDKEVAEESKKPELVVGDYSITKKGSKFNVVFSYDGDNHVIHQANNLEKAKDFLRKELKDNRVKHEEF